VGTAHTLLLLLLLLLRTLMSAYLSPPGMTRFIQSGFLLRSCRNSSQYNTNSVQFACASVMNMAVSNVLC
jgi:hypothetical protein